MQPKTTDQIECKRLEEKDLGSCYCCNTANYYSEYETEGTRHDDVYEVKFITSSGEQSHSIQLCSYHLNELGILATENAL